MTKIDDDTWAPWTWQPATDQMTWSNALHLLLGTDAALLTAPRLDDLLAHAQPTERARLHAALRGVREAALSTTTQLSRDDGTLLAVELRAAPAGDGVLGALHLQTASSSAAALRDRQNDSLGVLAGGIAHDFNNLLVGIMGNLDLARYSDASPRDTALHISAAMQAAERAAELCRQLLAYSGRGPSRFETLDVNARIGRIAGLLTGSLPRHTTLDVQLLDEPLRASIDPGQLTQLLLNLLTNAAEATPGKEARIRLSTSRRTDAHRQPNERFISGALAPGAFVAITVEDDGIGMDAALQARLGEPFFSTKGTGRGLGLAAALGIVKNHGGALALSSASAVGTRVVVLLPESTVQAERSSAATTQSRPTRTILVVDDEATVRDVMCLQLEKLGYHTLPLSNGRDCVEHVRTQHSTIDAVVLDQTMPVMGGSEAYQRLRDIAPKLPIILMTGFGQENIAGLINADRHAQFLPKPYALNRLQAALRQLLGE